MILDLIRGKQQKILREDPIKCNFKTPEEILGDYILGEEMIPFKNNEFYLERGKATFRYYYFSEWIVDTEHIGKEVTKFVSGYHFPRHSNEETKEDFYKYFGNGFSERERDFIIRQYAIERESLSYSSDNHGRYFYRIVEKSLTFDDFLNRHEKNATEIVNKINEQFIELIKARKNFGIQ